MIEDFDAGQDTKPITSIKRENLELSEGAPISEAALAIAAKPVELLGVDLLSGRLTLERSQEALEAAEKSYAARTHRSRYRTDEAHAASKGEHLPDLLAAENAALEAADRVFTQAKLIDEATAHDREPQLSDADMIRANSRREFVKEDCAELPLPLLKGKILHAIQSNDPALLWLYNRYATQRLTAGNPQDNAHGAVAAARSEIVDLLHSARSRMVDTRPRETNTRAKELRRKALDLQRRAGSRRQHEQVKHHSGYSL